MKVTIEWELTNPHKKYTPELVEQLLLYRIQGHLSPLRDMAKYLLESTASTQVQVKKLEVK